MLAYFHSPLTLLFSPPSVCIFFYILLSVSQLDLISDVGDKLFKSSNDLENSQQQTDNKSLLVQQKNIISSALADVGNVRSRKDAQGSQHLRNKEKDRTAKTKTKTTQRIGLISNSFHSLWVCVAILLHVVGESLVDAVCAPSSNDNMKDAVNACLTESSNGICGNFAAASNGAGCNDGGVNGVIGDWDVSRVTSMNNVFESKGSFNADISKWDTSKVITMQSSMSLSLTLFSLIYILFDYESFINK